MKKSTTYLLITLLSALSLPLLHAKDPVSWKEGKRHYRESVCNYEGKCMNYCTDNAPVSCNCFPKEEASTQTALSSMSSKIMALYGLFADDEDLCKYYKSCYQYGYCPVCDCDYSISEEELALVIKALNSGEIEL